MGIIGVVAALTLPNLNSSTGDKEKVTKVKKAYQNLSDALGRAQAVYGLFEEWKWGSDASDCSYLMGERFTEFMKVSKNCHLGDSTCAGSRRDPDSYNVILADGMSVSFSASNGDGSDAVFIVDIDGPNKGPNTSGKDEFKFIYDVDNGKEIYPAGYDIDTDYNLKRDCLERVSLFCTNWVIQNENMDYLKCPDKLSLTNTTCK